MPLPHRPRTLNCAQQRNMPASPMDDTRRARLDSRPAVVKMSWLLANPRCFLQRSLGGLLVPLALACATQGPAAAAKTTEPVVADPASHPTGLGPRVEPDPQGQIAVLANALHADDEDNGLTVLGDCNGDGRLDVYRTAHGRLLQQDAQGNFALVHTFDPRPAIGMDAAPSPLGSWHNAPNAAFGDMDGDGQLDLLVAGKELYLYKGLGNCSFGDRQALPKPCTTGTPAQIQTLDVDADGLLDLVLACDGAEDTPFRFLLSRGDGTFEVQAPPPVPFIKKAKGLPVFGSHFADVDGDGILDGFFMVDNSYGWFSWGNSADPPSFSRDDDLAHAVADHNGMAAAALDFDRDGRIDYFLSGTEQSDSLLWNSAPRKVLNIPKFAGFVPHPGYEGWTSFAFDADFDGWMDLLVLRARSPGEVPVGGDQSAQPWMYMNRHDGTFAQVADRVFGSQDSTFYALSMACGDLAGDGRVACLFTNQHAAVLLRNDIAPLGRWVGVRLHGTVSAPNARGARVALDGVTPPIVAEIGGQSATYGTHADGVLLAAGAATTVDLRVTWPSGLVQLVPGVPTNAYADLTEPRVVDVQQRVLPANGQATVDVILDPKAANMTNISVDLEGSGTWIGPLTPRPDGRLVRTLTAPSQPGTARIVVRLDGAPLLVRPRIHFQ